MTDRVLDKDLLLYLGMYMEITFRDIAVHKESLIIPQMGFDSFSILLEQNPITFDKAYNNAPIRYKKVNDTYSIILPFMSHLYGQQYLQAVSTSDYNKFVWICPASTNGKRIYNTF